jgi:hypothetical protein
MEGFILLKYLNLINVTKKIQCMMRRDTYHGPEEPDGEKRQLFACAAALFRNFSGEQGSRYRKK